MLLSEIVGQVLTMFNLGEHEYARFYSFGIRGVRNLNWDVTGEAIEVELPVDDDLTVRLPDDFIKELKVGVKGNGEFRALTRNNNLTPLADGCDRFCHETPFKNYSKPYPFYTYGTRSEINMNSSLGKGSHTNIGEFRIDMKSGKIILNPEFCHGCILLRYIARPSYGDCDIEVHEFASEAIAAFIEWMYKVGHPKFSQSERIEAQNRYQRMKKAANMRIKRPMVQDINQVIRQSIKEAPRH